MKNYIPENISFLVARMNCSQNEFGAMFGLNNGAVNSYVVRKALPKIETIQKICNYFEIRIDDFINQPLHEIGLNNVKSDAVNEPRDNYKKENIEIVDLLMQSLHDKDKIIASLERELSACKEE